MASRHQRLYETPIPGCRAGRLHRQVPPRNSNRGPRGAPEAAPPAARLRRAGYDNYNGLVIGFGPTERPSEAIVSIAARAGSVGLCFLFGASLPDPAGILQGEGSRSRFVRLESAATLATTEVDALLDAAIARSKTPFPVGGKGKLIVRSISAKQRPRRRA